MSLKIEKMTYNEIDEFITHKKNLIIRKGNDFYGLVYDDEIISVLSVRVKGEKAKLQSFFTKNKYRGKGYFSFLLEKILEKLKKDGIKIVDVDAMETSKKIMDTFDFTLLREKQFKNFKIYYYRRVL